MIPQEKNAWERHKQNKNIGIKMGFLKSNGMLACERCIFSGIMISATTLFYFGKYSYKQIKLAKPKLPLSHNIMSLHHYRVTALSNDNT